MSEHDTVAVSICCCDETWHLRNEVSRLSGAGGGGYLLPCLSFCLAKDPVISGIAQVHYAGCRVDDYSFTQMIREMLRIAVYGSV
ncbi:MAG: hypothetical protein DMG42_16125 [Acidobacteria bacterium]|nr:MAG: hypothetical protein AUH13_00230 [Acidobacteria bacterium 13_2_20CM_58_27]PYT71644.1 MAG: hypothetical protein DMG42_16125 [Acidobacteriota bacterium]